MYLLTHTDTVNTQTHTQRRIHKDTEMLSHAHALVKHTLTYTHLQTDTV